MSKFLMALIALVATPVTLAQKSSFFVVGADPQMGFYSQNKDMTHEEANTTYFVASVNRLKLSFFVVCGDLVDAAGNLEQIKRYKEIMQQIDPDIPVHYVAGNHDVAFGNVARTLASYRKEFGPDYYVFDSGEVRNIVLDSTLIRAPQDAPEEAKAQKQWLIDELERATQEGIKNIFIFQHIPYFLEDPDEPDQYYNIPGHHPEGIPGSFPAI
jgi:serine/threonine-protein phosphatase CPPED1